MKVVRYSNKKNIRARGTNKADKKKKKDNHLGHVKSNYYETLLKCLRKYKKRLVNDTIAKLK